MGAFDDGLRVDDVGTAKEHQRDGNEESGFVDGGEKFVEIESNGIRTWYQLDPRAMLLLLMIEVLNRGKLEVGHHHFVARPAKIEARRDDRLGDRHILMQRDFAG